MTGRAMRHARRLHGTTSALLTAGLVAAFAALVPAAVALPGGAHADNPALVSLDSVSNGCGGGVASKDPRFADSWTYYEFTVNFREACNVHDAAYSGAVVFDPFSRKVIDFRTWTQKEIDDKFFDDLRTLCRRQIMAQSAGAGDRAAKARNACEGKGDPTSLGAENAYAVVRRFGSIFYRQRVDLTGGWINRGTERSLRSARIVQRGRLVSISWQGADGLCGSGEGTLISRDQDEEVVGTLTITGFANGKTFEGRMRLQVDGKGSGLTVTLPSVPGSPTMHRGAVKRTTQGRAATCARPTTPVKPKPPAAAAGSYRLVPALTEVKNPITTSEVTANAGAGKVLWDHTGPFGGAGKGGEWKVEYTFAPPQTLTPGKTSSMTVGMKVTNVLPEQPILFSMSVRAYDFKEQFDLPYPKPSSASETYRINVLASHKGFKELFVIVNCGAVEVVYHYRPVR